MIDASSYRASEILRNGLAVTIRAVRPDDKEALRRAFRGLESQTIYRRFLAYRKDLTEEELERATAIDFRREVGLVACVEGAGGGDRIIGTGRYFADDPDAASGQAEVAFVVEEDFQGLGLAGRLLRHLAAIADARGIHTFNAITLPENRSMQRVFQRSGYPATQTRQDDLIHIEMVLK